MISHQHLCLLTIVMLLAPSRGAATVTSFFETFSGNGPYQSVGETLVGLDNPDWEFYAAFGIINEFDKLDDGYQFNIGSAIEDIRTITRTLSGTGSYSSSVHLSNLNAPKSVGVVAVSHRFTANVNERVSIAISVNPGEIEWGALACAQFSCSSMRFAKPTGGNLEVLMEYDEPTAEI
ncbi:MAG: hypothetical protein KDB23_10335, partial [Planctomycetales bacterium]|nr:hypothetical protein [Planctomycetales bacterium]